MKNPNTLEDLKKYWEEKEKELKAEEERKSVQKQWSENELEEMIGRMIDERINRLKISE